MKRELDSSYLKDIVSIALREDLGEQGDITSQAILSPESMGRAEVISRSAGVVAGVFFAEEVFRQIDSSVVLKRMASEGGRIEPGKVVFEVSGCLRSILAGERTALNFLQHLSGIATLTAKYVEQVSGFPAKILDTRKTLPGLRLLEKYAVTMGGGANHRQGLYDAVLIKDNHIKAAGGIRGAVEKIRESLSPGALIEIEVGSRQELEESLELGVDVIMLDNLAPQEMSEMVRIAGGRAKLEASGGITLRNVREVAATGVDFISIGRLTHSAPALDFSLELE